MKKYLIAAALVSAISGVSLSQISFAETPSKVSAKEAKYQQKKAEWNKLTKEQKVKMLNDRQAQKIKSSQERWAKLSDEQKIARYENGSKRGYEMSKKHAEYRDKCDKALGTKK